MAQGKGNSDPCQRVLAIDSVDSALKPDDRVQLQQGDGGGGPFQINTPVLDSLHDCCQQRLGIYLQANRKRGRRNPTGAVGPVVLLRDRMICLDVRRTGCRLILEESPKADQQSVKCEQRSGTKFL